VLRYALIMSTRKIVRSPQAPPAVGPYSQGVHTGSLIFLAGQIPLVGDTGKFIDGGIKEQTEQVIANIKALLSSEGLGLQDVVKATVFLADMGEFATMNEVYAKHFVEPYPARSTVKDARVEIEVIAQVRS
jgi:2-iminobutanoate/2-iminopropanoate deaminase